MKTQLINFVIPKKLLKEVDLLARRQAKSRSSLLREGAYLITREAKEKKVGFATVVKSAEGLGLAQDEAITLIDKVRDSLQINK